MVLLSVYPPEVFELLVRLLLLLGLLMLLAVRYDGGGGAAAGEAAGEAKVTTLAEAVSGTPQRKLQHNLRQGKRRQIAAESYVNYTVNNS